MEPTISLSLHSILKTQLVALRDSSVIIEELISNSTSNSIQLDFSNIKFISRAFAQSLIQLQDLFKFKDKQIYFSNTTESVEEMFLVVKYQQEKMVEKERDSLLPKNQDFSSFRGDFFDIK